MATSIPIFNPVAPGLPQPVGSGPIPSFFGPTPMAPGSGPTFAPSEQPMRRDQVLRIVDHFVAPPFGMGGPPPHGQSVEEAVRATGYQGQVERSQMPREVMTGDVARVSLEALSRPGMSPQDASAALAQTMINSQNNTINGAAQALNQDVRAGATNAVTNLSYGTGPAAEAARIYRLARQGWEPAPPALPNANPNMPNFAQMDHERSRNLMTNLANAWGIDPAALTSSDPAINGPARQSFQQNLINQAQNASQHPSVQGALQNYRRAEEGFAANNNTLVVSAGNWGGLLSDMRRDNGDRPLTTAANFNDNLLVGRNSISVGSLDINPETGAPQRASYSNADQRVDLYAYGELNGINGTSFAAPRVAAVAQAVRLENPNASAAEVRQRVMQIFTTEGPGAATTNHEQSGNVANYLGQVQWPRQTYRIGMN